MDCLENDGYLGHWEYFLFPAIVPILFPLLTFFLPHIPCKSKPIITLSIHECIVKKQNDQSADNWAGRNSKKNKEIAVAIQISWSVDRTMTWACKNFKYTKCPIKTFVKKFWGALQLTHNEIPAPRQYYLYNIQIFHLLIGKFIIKFLKQCLHFAWNATSNGLHSASLLLVVNLSKKPM
jgi:hypothetical protein